MEFNIENLIVAIKKIDENPELKNNRSSSTYDLIYKGNKYPPILVLSVANQINGGKELLLSDFDNNIEKPFKILRDNGFEIVKKNNEVNFWIEKTITKKRVDRLEGDRALGKALWSPQKGQSGADIYKNMTLVKKGDYILHLVDNSSISGISIVKNKAVETNGIEGTEWNGPAYLITLESYTPLKIPLSRTDVLKLSNKDILENISKSSEVFYNKKLDLRQGAYLTPCPIELLELINNEYYKLNAENIPLIKLNPKKVINMKNEFNYKTFHQYTKDAGLIFTEKMVARFVASLCTKPFVICSGLSGSGKTKLAQSFVQWISESDQQYKIVPVGADWTNREPLLGYPNALKATEYISPDNGVLDLILQASNNKNLPYFLILDEMNLSHVERYFADFLSTMESKDAIPLHADNLDGVSTRQDSKGDIIPNKINLPSNLFIIGTVNIDETTYMFSPKVLDRANAIEFRITDKEIENYLDNPGILDMKKFVDQVSKKGFGASMASNFLNLAEELATSKKASTALVIFFKELKKAGAEFGYRSASEINRLVAILESLTKEDTLWDNEKVNDNDFIDIAIMQKLLPKLHGSRSKLCPILLTLAKFCILGGINDFDKKDDDFRKTYFKDFEDIASDKKELIIYPISFEKIARMHKNAIDNGFTSYAEA